MKRFIQIFFIFFGMLAVSRGALAADTTVIVSPINPNGWTYTNFGTDASQAFVDGPDSPPLGNGSSSFSHSGPPGFNGGTLHTSNLNGIYLRDITELKYSTYQQGDPNLLFQPPYVQIFLDLDNDGLADDGIGFEPSWQTSGRFMVSGLQGTPFTVPNVNVEQNGLGSTGGGVEANRWWEWDLLIGSWYARFGGELSTGPAGTRLGVFQCFFDGCATIEAIADVYPDAKIVSQTGGTGGVRLQYGFGGNSDEYVGHVDKLVIGLANGDTMTYDFELGPTSKDECKQGGWERFFKNQGQCVSYFVSHRPQ